MNERLNGSVKRLAEAFGDVMPEAMETVRQDLHKDVREEIREAEERLTGKIDRAVEDIIADAPEGERDMTAPLEITNPRYAGATVRALAFLLLFALAPLAVKAEQYFGNSFYGSVSGMAVVPRDSDLSPGGTAVMDPGIGFLAAVGYGGRKGPRAEVEIGYRQADLDRIRGVSVTGDVFTLSLMLNGIFVIDTGWMRPYFGAGIGLVRHDASNARWSGNDTVLGFQGIAGYIVPLDDFEIRLGYRYFATAEGEFDSVDATYGAHNVEAGVLFRF